MARRLKLLTGLSTIALTGALGACDRQNEAVPVLSHHPTDGAAETDTAAAPVGGEAEGAAIANVATDKAAYVSALQLVRGHLRAGGALYAAGERELGSMHLRHPQAEILTTLAPAFSTYGAATIEPAIDALADAGEAGAPPARIEELEAAALASIAAASADAAPTLKERLLAVAKTLTVAGDEYTIAVKDGAMANLHEYQDAFGFLATAIEDLKALRGADAVEEQAIATALDQAMIASGAAPTIAPPQEGFKPGSVIYGAAARVEIAARNL